MAQATKPVQRPLSPHLQIYKPMLSTAMSIVHRITGVALYAGTLLLAWYLLALANGPESFASAQAFFGSWFGKLVLFGYTWALMHHMMGGIRHFIWDTGNGFELGTVEVLMRLSLAASLALTVLIWFFVLV